MLTCLFQSSALLRSPTELPTIPAQAESPMKHRGRTYAILHCKDLQQKLHQSSSMFPLFGPSASEGRIPDCQTLQIVLRGAGIASQSRACVRTYVHTVRNIHAYRSMKGTCSSPSPCSWLSPNATLQYEHRLD
ncbi:hypothetical protein CCMA1212_000826 [Trichoderma ghanense]|uniref:Uncharacterized protein n=1 Tax=Trichoderma ghanense TaxID=65468 RepID=A0ABY2HFU6_9HYPO